MWVIVGSHISDEDIDDMCGDMCYAGYYLRFQGISVGLVCSRGL
jgi:hypothetical protein